MEENSFYEIVEPLDLEASSIEVSKDVFEKLKSKLFEAPLVIQETLDDFRASLMIIRKKSFLHKIPRFGL